jgi:hypothetical protein
MCLAWFGFYSFFFAFPVEIKSRPSDFNPGERNIVQPLICHGFILQFFLIPKKYKAKFPLCQLVSQTIL